MRLIRVLLCGMGFLCLGVNASAQEISLWRTGTIVISELNVIEDSLTVVGETVRFFFEDTKKAVDEKAYKMEGNRIIWDNSWQKNHLGKRLALRYRVLPYNLSKPYAILDSSVIEEVPSGTSLSYVYNTGEDGVKNPFQEMKGLNYGGSYVRGLSFGNRQNLVVNSSFNLQLSGLIGDDIEVVAAISDQNIPIQPEGNTQQLQEFDRIYIELKKGNHAFLAGDYELGRPDGYFLNYYKKLRGATYNGTWDLDNGGQVETKVSGAIARGKFSRNVLEVIEGNQGPYRLRGSAGEQFIIILAGTERVYWDGVRLKRGEQGDYVINYNQSEITFTSKRMITKDSRIIVEFDYADQEYLRSLYATQTKYKKGKWEFELGVYSEQDSKGSGSIQDLDSLERALLRDAGDAIGVIGGGIDTTSEFSAIKVLYELIDTAYVVEGEERSEQVLLFASDSLGQFYEAQFVEVGSGNGDYVLEQNVAANGRVYRWVAPDSMGIPQGNFVVGRVLTAPSLQQMYTFRTAWRPSKSVLMRTEVAMSNRDENRFSRLDDQDNYGLGVQTEWRWQQALGTDSSDWSLNTQLWYEFAQDRFEAIAPYRSAEFARDWGLTNGNLLSGNNGLEGLLRKHEHLGRAGTALENKQLGSLAYQIQTLQREELYQGWRHVVDLDLDYLGFGVRGQGNWLDTKGEDLRKFTRPKLELSKEVGSWRASVYGERERQEVRTSGSDSLRLGSFYYDLWRASLSREGENMNGVVSYQERWDFAPDADRFTTATFARDFTASGTWRKKEMGNLKWVLTYRTLVIEDEELSNQDPQETLLGRLDHSGAWAKGMIRSSTSYEIGSGQEPRVQVTYLRVNPGEGTHIWLDSLNNNDGQIQPNEMEIAPFADIADYVQLSNVTGDFIRTDNVQLNQSLQLEPRLRWANKKGWRKWLSYLSTQTTLLLQRKSREGAQVDRWDPFAVELKDTALVQLSQRIANKMFIDRANPNYDLQLGWLEGRNRQVLTTGFEDRSNKQYFIQSRWNVNRRWTVGCNVRLGEQNSDSEVFNQRDYELRTGSLEPSVTWQPSSKLRMVAGYFYNDKENVLETGEGEEAIEHRFELSMTFNQSNKTNLRMKVSGVEIDFTGQTNTPVGFAILQGLQNGRNYLWNVNLDRRLGAFLQLGLNYEGRKTGDAAIVHVGGIQMRANF